MQGICLFKAKANISRQCTRLSFPVPWYFNEIVV